MTRDDQTVDDRTLARGFRNGWILVVLSIGYVAGAFFFAWHTNRPAPPARWDMGGVPFVPASAPGADGYYTPTVESGRVGLGPGAAR